MWKHPVICVKALQALRLSNLSKVVQWRCSGRVLVVPQLNPGTSDAQTPHAFSLWGVRFCHHTKSVRLAGMACQQGALKCLKLGPWPGRGVGVLTGSALTFFCTHGLNWPPYPCCRVSAQSELRSSKCCASQSGHASSDRPSLEILLGPPHSMHICNTSSCLRLQGCFVVRA